MQFLDLKKQYKSIKKETDMAIQTILNSCSFILGTEVEKLEKRVAKYCNTKYAVGLNSGTDALLLSLMALNIGKGDEVITTPFTFIATVDVIALIGAKPVFVDIKPKTFNIDPEKIEKKITNKTKAIIPVHLFGQPAEMDKIMKIAKKYKLKVIEDCAQAIGAKYKNRIVGSIGHIGCLSFFPSKNLGAYGDGGMVITSNKQLAEKIKSLRIHGGHKKYVSKILGINSRLDAIQAAILNVKLKHLNSWTKIRGQKAEIYNHAFKNIKYITTPFVEENDRHAYHQYTIRAKRRNKLQVYLKQHSIPTIIYYPVPLHLQQVFKYLCYIKGDFPVAEKTTKEILSIPIYPELSTKKQNKIINTIKRFYV